jgi:CRP/FNR family transcriptional regulator, cyclic AMP receptor protein
MLRRHGALRPDAHHHATVVAGSARVLVHEPEIRKEPHAVSLAAMLATVPLFEALSPGELDELAQGLERMSLDAGKTVFTQGDPGGEMYLVVDGGVDITVGAGAAPINVAALFAGQYFGELSLFDGLPRSATATASKKTELLRLGRADLVRFIEKNPEGAMKILAEISTRLRKTNELMSSQVSRDVLTEREEHLGLGDRVADKVATFGGSWSFLGLFFFVIFAWLLTNIALPFDVPGFMILNLVLAVIAAGQAPVIMMSQNRQESKNKLLAENDYRVNLKNELGIANAQKALAEVLQKATMLEKTVASLSRSVDALRPTPPRDEA